MRLLQMHLQDTPTRFGIGSNRAKVALSILQQSVGRRTCNGLDSVTTQKPKKHMWKSCEETIGVAILDDGMQVWVSPPLLFFCLLVASFHWSWGAGDRDIHLDILRFELEICAYFSSSVRELVPKNEGTEYLDHLGYPDYSLN